jgi:hypothetical protein
MALNAINDVGNNAVRTVAVKIFIAVLNIGSNLDNFRQESSR